MPKIDFKVGDLVHVKTDISIKHGPKIVYEITEIYGSLISSPFYKVKAIKAPHQVFLAHELNLTHVNDFVRAVYKRKEK